MGDKNGDSWRNFFLILHIGDGVIGYLQNDKVKIASFPENAEFANATFFTTSSNAIVKMKIIKGELNSIDGFVLLSDGSEASLYDKRNKVLAPAIKTTMKLAQVTQPLILQELLFKQFEKTIRHATSDDCSLILLVKPPSNFYGYKNMNTFEKEKLLGFKPYMNNSRRIKNYDKLLSVMQTDKNISEISKLVHLKKKYLLKRLKLLLTKKLIIKQNEKYKTAIIMELSDEEK